MAGSVNKVILLGNVGKDPEIKAFSNGNKIASLSLATTETWRDKATGEKRERTEWSRINVNGEGLVGVVERYVRKGSKLYVEGKLATRKWTAQDGTDRYVTEINVSGFGGQIVLLGSPNGAHEPARQQQQEMSYGDHRSDGGEKHAYGTRDKAQSEEELGDSIPF